MPKRILPPNRPKISRREIESVIAYHQAVFPHLFKNGDYVRLVAIRGYFLNTFGNDNENDDNCYDDAMIAVSPRYYKTFNANVDPSFVKDPNDGRPLARLKLGVYRFYKGKHKGQYDAFRAFPEGVKLPCTRAGQASVCSAINIHYGGENPGSWYVTWSHGCLTLPKTQFVKEFRPEVYDEMTKYSQTTLPVILIEKVVVDGVQRFRAVNGQIIPHNFQVELLTASTQPIEPALASQEESASQFLSFDEVTEPFARATDSISGAVEEFSEQSQSAMSESSEALNDAMQTGSDQLGQSASDLAGKFNPLDIPAMIPRFGKQWLLGLFPTGGVFMTALAYIQNAPMWLVFILGFITGAGTVAFILLGYQHRRFISQVILKCVDSWKDPNQNNLIPTPAREFMTYKGQRRDTLKRALRGNK